MDLSNISRLPCELRELVLSFVPLSVILRLNKMHYVPHHLIVRHIVPKTNYESYIRSMIRRDNDFVFRLLLQENVAKWALFKKYSYKKETFDNYIYFLLEYCIENESDKCKQLINRHLKQGL